MSWLKSVRGISQLLACILVCIVAIISGVLFYLLCTHLAFTVLPSNPSSRPGTITIMGSKSGPGYVVYYVLSRGNVTLHELVIKYLNGTVACVEDFPGGLRLRPNTLNTVPVIGTLLHCAKGIPDEGYTLFMTSSSVVASSPPTNFDPVKTGLMSIRFAYFEDEVARSTDKLYVNLSSDYWDSILVYPFSKIYAIRCKGSSCTPIWSKTTTILPIGQNVLDIESMTLEQRYNLGPIVVVINPTYGTSNWTFKIIDALGYVHTFVLKKITSSRTDVVVDMLLLWEDTWHPGVLKEIAEGLYNPDYVIDNWLDSIIRITIFTNNTARIKVLSESGAWMHAFFLEPPRPSSIDTFLKNDIPNDVLRAIAAIESGKGYISPYGLKYIKPYFNDIHQIYWVPSGKLIDLSTVVWMCNLATGKCRLEG